MHNNSIAGISLKNQNRINIVPDRELSQATMATRAENNTKAAKAIKTIKSTQTTKTKKGKKSFIIAKTTLFT